MRKLVQRFARINPARLPSNMALSPPVSRSQSLPSFRALART